MTAKRPIAFAIGLLLGITAYAQSVEEGVFHDPLTGDYTVRYVAPADEQGPSSVEEGTYFPDTKIDPVLTSSVEISSEKVRYRFSIASATTSRQPLINLGIPCEGYLSIDQWESPSAWRVMNNLSNRVPQTRDVRWLYRDLEENPAVPPTKGLAPGARQGGFALTSSSLPGVGTACMRGNGQLHTFSTQYLDPNSAVGIRIHQKLQELRKSDHVRRFAAMPMFGVGPPIEVSTTLQSIRDHVKLWPEQQLMDSGFWSVIDSLLGAAINSLKKRDVVGAGASLTQIRVELRRKYPDLDVATTLDDPQASDLPPTPEALKAHLSVYDHRLAGKVLDFDVAFLTMKLDPADQLQADAPWQGTMYAPPLDTDGSFRVSWSAPIATLQTVCKTDIGGCKEILMGYALETADNAQFTGVRVIYDGPDRQFQVSQYPLGAHFFRVKAHMLRCKGPSGLSWEQWTCEAGSSDAEPVDTNYYAVGPNVTVVTPR